MEKSLMLNVAKNNFYTGQSSTLFMRTVLGVG